MTGSLRWGILATGGIAHSFAADLLVAGTTIAAVGSQTQGRADEFAARFGIPRAHGSYEALAADPDVDVVYVATPHPFHAENALACLRAGKHVLVEKPFTLNRREAAEVAECAAERGLLVQEAMWTRFLPHMRRIRELVRSGAVGEVRAVLADHAQKLSDDPEHRILNPRLGGGALLDLGVYPVSFAWDVLGEPQVIRAVSTQAVTGVDRHTSVLFGYADGAQATLQAQLDGRGTNRAAIIGTEARIEVEPVWYSASGFRLIGSDDREIEHVVCRIDGKGLHCQATAVEEAVAAGLTSTAELPVQESVRIMGCLDEIRAQIGLSYPGEA